MILSMQYSQDDINSIINNIDLLEYASNSFEFCRRGNNYFTCCNKHIDDTPSLSIDSNSNLFYCFSCGRAGNIINWMMEYENLSFKNSIEKCALLSNTDLTKICQSQTVLFLKNILKKERKTINNERKILNKSILNQYTKDEVKEWLDEGILQEDLNLYEVMIDKKSNRIIYPVYDIDSQLINIKGRTRHINYKEMRLPKYINYFPVNTMDYFQGLNISLNDIKDAGEIIIFESIKSVMKLRKFGMKNSASAEKHTLTDEQIKLLIKLRVDIVLAYDSDVSYREKEVRKNINKLKKFTNVYIIEDKDKLLGGIEAKNSPVDKSKEIWDRLYVAKQRVL